LLIHYTTVLLGIAQHLLGGTEESHKKSVRIGGLWVENHI